MNYWKCEKCGGQKDDSGRCQLCAPSVSPPATGYAAGVIRQMQRVEEELNEFVMTPGIEEPLKREAATIAEAFKNRRIALERMWHSHRLFT